MVVHRTPALLFSICLLAQPWARLVGDEPLSRFALAATIELAVGSVAVQSPATGEAAVENPAPGELGQHPLEPLLDLARDTTQRITAEVKDYTCTLVKR